MTITGTIDVTVVRRWPLWIVVQHERRLVEWAFRRKSAEHKMARAWIRSVYGPVKITIEAVEFVKEQS